VNQGFGNFKAVCKITCFAECFVKESAAKVCPIATVGTAKGGAICGGGCDDCAPFAFDIVDKGASVSGRQNHDDVFRT
jgi:hypothetical protein